MEELLTPDEADAALAGLPEIVAAVNRCLPTAIIRNGVRYIDKPDLETAAGRPLSDAGCQAFTKYATKKGWQAEWLTPPGGRKQLSLARADD